VGDQASVSGDQRSLFWDRARDALKAFVESHRSAPMNSHKKWSQNELARTMGLSPQRLSNFLSARGRTDSINGRALAIACSLGIDFECNQKRIGCLDRRRDEAMPQTSEAQLTLEFGDEFYLVPELEPLTIRFRKGPSRAGSEPRPAIRLRISS
jgi:transcriptional regulator with XRE-family HTH domain